MNRKEAQHEIERVLGKARELFNFTPSIETRFDNMGRIAGEARHRYGRYTLRLNLQLLTPEYAHEAVDTIAHEIAHLVCYFNPRLGKNHDAGWRRVCIMLGGSGSRTHELPLKKARRTRKAIYNVRGNELNLGLTKHKRLQAGKYRSFRHRRFGEILPEHFTGQIVMA